MILITHDLGVVASLCDRVVVMYSGQVVEDARVKDLFDNPAHPYTRGLLSSVPHPGRPPETLSGIPGSLPNLLAPPAGCRFQDRCAHAMAACTRMPELMRLGAGRSVACWLHGEKAGA